MFKKNKKHTNLLGKQIWTGYPFSETVAALWCGEAFISDSEAWWEDGWKALYFEK